MKKNYQVTDTKFTKLWETKKVSKIKNKKIILLRIQHKKLLENKNKNKIFIKNIKYN